MRQTPHARPSRTTSEVHHETSGMADQSIHWQWAHLVDSQGISLFLWSNEFDRYKGQLLPHNSDARISTVPFGTVFPAIHWLTA